MPATAQQEREFAFTERDFRFLGKLVYEQTGIVLSGHKQDMVYSRLARRLRALGLRDFAHYCDLLRETNSQELGNLVNAITTNLTSFFREPHHFEHLREQVLAPLRLKNPRVCVSGLPPARRVWKLTPSP